MPGVRRPWALASIAFLVLAAPSVQAAPPSVSATATVTLEVPVADLVAVDQPPPAEPTAPPPCASRHVTLHPPSRSFRFAEAGEEAGCAMVRFDLTLPAGADAFQLSFRANRSVRQDLVVPTGQPPQMVQEVRLLLDGQVHQRQAVFDPEEMTRPEDDHPMRFQIPRAGAKIQLEWYFADEGRSATRPGRVESFAAAVFDPVVTTEDIDLPLPPLESGTPQLGDDERTRMPYTVETRVPAALASFAAEGSIELAVRFDVNGTLLFSGVVDADGQGVEAPYSVEEEGSGNAVHVVRLTGPLLREHGPGPYRVEVLVEERLRSDPLFGVLSWLVLAAPAAALVVAWLGLRRTELGREPEEE
jgi:hypothetical protein